MDGEGRKEFDALIEATAKRMWMHEPLDPEVRMFLALLETIHETARQIAITDSRDAARTYLRKDLIMRRGRMALRALEKKGYELPEGIQRSRAMLREVWGR